MAETIFPGALNGLEEFIVHTAPPTIYYIPNFITEEEENYLLKQVNSAPKPKWTHLRHRRLQNWGGVPVGLKGMMPEKLPQWLARYCDKISSMGVFDGKQANHVLVNEYLEGQGIMPHLDGDLYYPTVSTVSLGSHTLLDFYKPLSETGTNGEQNEQLQSQTDETQGPTASAFETRHVTSVLLEPRSLVLLKEDMYKKYLHGIAERTADEISPTVANLDQCDVKLGQKLTRTTRVSLTIRHVPKMIKFRLV